MSDLGISSPRLIIGANDPLLQTTATDTTTSSTSTQDAIQSLLNGTSSVSNSTTPAATTDISKGAQLFSKLAQLQKSDPDKFKQVLSNISDELKKQADSTTDDKEKAFLTDLSTKFGNVANGTADLSTLQPPQKGQGHHHHHGSKSQGSQLSAYSQNSSQASSLQQLTSSSGSQTSGQGGQQSGTDPRQIFKSIYDELNSAVSGIDSTPSDTTAVA